MNHLVGGCCFIIPAAVLVTLIAAVYVRYGSLPRVAGILYGIKPAVIAIILQALWRLSRTAIKSKLLAVTGVVAVILNSVGFAPLIVLAIAGIAACAVVWFKKQGAVALSAVSWFGRLGRMCRPGTSVPRQLGMGDRWSRVDRMASAIVECASWC